MKIINIIGGLGNQMFQYAFALSIQKRYPDEQVLIDNQHCRSLFLKSHKGMNLHQGYELGRVFQGVELPLADRNNLGKVTRNVPNYFLSRVVRRYLKPLKTEYIEVNPYVFSHEAISMKGDCYYEGYWQSMRYWEGTEDDIRTAMSFKELDDRNATIATGMNGCESVSIHVRRGDYVNNPGFGGICDINYYQRSIELVRSRMNNPVFYLFTNDHGWCMANIIPLLSIKALYIFSVISKFDLNAFLVTFTYLHSFKVQ